MSITLVLLSACSNGPVIDEQVEQPVEVLYNEALDLALANQPKKQRQSLKKSSVSTPIRSGLSAPK